MKILRNKKVLAVIGLMIITLCLTACNAADKTKDVVSDVQMESHSKEQVAEIADENVPQEEVSEETEPEDSGESEVTVEQDSEPEATNAEQDSELKVTEMATPSACGALHVEGTRLVDSKGNPVQLRGISTHGLSWFPQYVNQELFNELREDWNANVMRLAMYTAENGGYCTDGDKNKLKQLVKDGVQYATNADMYVIIDWHVLRDENPNHNKDEAKKFFEEMSGEYANADNVIYEICNEPNGATSWSEVKSYAEEIIPIIRANDKDALIIVGTPTWCQDVDKAAADPITGHDNIMYALHFYATTHTDWLRDRMNQAIDAGLPIFVSEFGTCDASGSGAFDEHQSNEWIKALDAKGVSYVTWNLSNKNETSSIFKDGCAKTSGFTQDDLSQNGKWIYALLTGEREVGISDSAKAEELQEPADAVFGKSNDFKYTAVLTGSWEADGKTFYQYTLSLENISGNELDGWEIEVSFSDRIEFSDGWNGDYTVDGKRLRIASKDYNQSVPPGGMVTDVGFIISSNPQLTIKQ